MAPALTIRPGRCTAAGSPITVFPCWRPTCPAMAAPAARRCRPSPTWRTGPPPCSMPPRRRRQNCVGHSMGSLIALETAARHPAKVVRPQLDRHRRHHDRGPGPAESRGSQRPCRHRHGLDLGARLYGRARRQPCAGALDAQRRATRAAAMPPRRALQRPRRLQRLPERAGRRGAPSRCRPPSSSANAT